MSGDNNSSPPKHASPAPLDGSPRRKGSLIAGLVDKVARAASPARQRSETDLHNKDTSPPGTMSKRKGSDIAAAAAGGGGSRQGTPLRRATSSEIVRSVTASAPPSAPTPFTQSVAPDHEIKMVILGSRNAGKTSYMRRAIDPSAALPTPTEQVPGLDKKSYVYRLPNNKKILCTLWDCKWDTVRLGSAELKAYLRGAHAAIVMYDDASYDSFEQVEIWLKEVLLSGIQYQGVFFNKRFNKNIKDLAFLGEVKANKAHALFWEGNVKENVNVVESLNDLLTLMYYSVLDQKRREVISAKDFSKKQGNNDGPIVHATGVVTPAAVAVATFPPLLTTPHKPEEETKPLNPQQQQQPKRGCCKSCLWGFFCCYWCCKPKHSDGDGGDDSDVENDDNDNVD